MSDSGSGEGRQNGCQRKSSNFLGGCLTGCFMALVLLVGVPVALVTLVTCKIGALVEAETTKAGGKKAPSYEYTWRWGDGDASSVKVVRLYLKGVIMGDGEEDSLFTTRKRYEHALVSRIRAATENKEIGGIWMDIESPGGAVTLSDEIRHALVLFKRSRQGRFVFARFGDQACSGGYYVATAADYIMASPTTWTGSIGVIIPAVNAAKLAEKLGVESVNIVSAENKAILDMLEPVNTNHVAILQRSVDQAYERFLSLVSESRGVPADELRPVADGRILTAQDALEAKLIDAIGYEEDALRQVEAMAKAADSDTSGVRVYTMDSDDGFFKVTSAFRMASEFMATLRLSAASTPAAVSSEPPPQYSR